MQIPIYITVLSLFIVTSTLIPLIRNDFWTFRVFEYPRLQKLMVNLMLLIVIALFYQPAQVEDYILVILLFVNAGYLAFQIYPFTVFGKKQIVTTKIADEKGKINMLIANVYQDNRNAEAYFKVIKQQNPDLILLVETNSWWLDQMNTLQDAYPYTIKIPLENTYGMLLYSKLQLIDGQIKFLVEDDIPSIETEVQLRSGQHVKLFCLHPKPPVPNESPTSTERDMEILLVAQKAKASKLPVIVAGDLNDVAWSYTTELFIKTSGLLDPRRGRGFYNSFHARYFFLRFSLDHIFCSTDFTLSKLSRLQNCGSDHFPISVELQIDKRHAHENEPLEADAEDKALATEKINATT